MSVLYTNPMLKQEVGYLLFDIFAAKPASFTQDETQQLFVNAVFVYIFTV